jgi:hypothetical protein
VHGGKEKVPPWAGALAQRHADARRYAPNAVALGVRYVTSWPAAVGASYRQEWAHTLNAAGHGVTSLTP